MYIYMYTHIYIWSLGPCSQRAISLHELTLGLKGFGPQRGVPHFWSFGPYSETAISFHHLTLELKGLSLSLGSLESWTLFRKCNLLK